MEKILTLILLFSFVPFFLITWTCNLLERKLARERTQRMQKYSESLDPSRKFHDLSLTYVSDPKLRILIWTKSYRSWIEIADYAHRSTFMALLAAASVLVVSLICSNFLGITLP